MADTGGEIVKAVLDKTIGPVMDLVTKIAGPAAEEIGYTLQDRIKFFRARQTYRLLEKMDQMIREAGFEPRPIALKLLLPALEFASMEEDEDLHTIWAAMLANAADPTCGEVHPCFWDILRELNRKDIKFLENLYDHMRRADLAKRPWDVEPLAIDRLMKIYWEVNGPDNEHFGIMLDNLIRLRILEIVPYSTVSKKDLRSESDDPPFVYVHTVRYPKMTTLGERFIAACRDPSSNKPDKTAASS